VKFPVEVFVVVFGTRDDIEWLSQLGARACATREDAEKLTLALGGSVARYVLAEGDDVARA